MAKAKTVQVPTAEDAEAFIKHFDCIFLLAAANPHRGVDDDHPGIKRTYHWLKGLARDGWESK